MASLPVDFYRALRSVKIGEDTAQKVVESLEGHIAMKITEATKGLQEQLKLTNILLMFLGLMSTAAAGIGSYLAIMSK